MTGVFTKLMYNKFSLVAMATSLENVDNKFEIANHENTTIGVFVVCAILAMKSKIQLP